MCTKISQSVFKCTKMYENVKIISCKKFFFHKCIKRYQNVH